jgi:DNA-directed RNA polymerase specialized sigma24 family protein
MRLRFCLTAREDHINGQTERPDLLRRDQAGNRNAWGQLLENCRPHLSILAARRLNPLIRTRLDGLDIMQQTCLEVR